MRRREQTRGGGNGTDVQLQRLYCSWRGGGGGVGAGGGGGRGGKEARSGGGENRRSTCWMDGLEEDSRKTDEMEVRGGRGDAEQRQEVIDFIFIALNLQTRQRGKNTRQ